MKKKRREGVKKVQGEVYADLYFLINMGMDLVGLMITAALMHRKGRKWRLVLAAALGGGYALVALLLGLSGWTSLIADLLAALDRSRLLDLLGLRLSTAAADRLRILHNNTLSMRNQKREHPNLSGFELFSFQLNDIILSVDCQQLLCNTHKNILFSLSI
jgi:hypothetical protein